MKLSSLSILFPLFALTDASTFTALNRLNPQIPDSHLPTTNTRFFTSPPDPFRVTDGSEIKPDYDGADWNRRDPMFNIVNASNDSKLNDWFPSISRETGPSNHDKGSIDTATLPNYKEFIHKVSVIDANNFYTTSVPYHRDLKLLSLAYNLMTATSRELNVLHLGTGSGYVPLALTIFGRHDDTIVTVNDQGDSGQAKENVKKDGKGHFLRNLNFITVQNIPNSIISRPSNGRAFDLIVLSQSVPRNYSFPGTLIGVMSPKGYLIYPEDGKRFKLDRLDGNGNLINLKSVNYT